MEVLVESLRLISHFCDYCKKCNSEEKKQNNRKERQMSTMNELASAVKGIRECKVRIAGCLAAIKEEKEASCRRFEKSGNKSDVRFVMENSRIERSLGVLLSGRAAVRALFFDKGVLIVRESGMQWCSTVSEAVNALSRECEEVEIWTEVE